MSYDSIRNKRLVEFPNGKLMLFCEVSSSNVRDSFGKRCWDVCLDHPKDSLYYTKESIKERQDDYVQKQLDLCRDFRKEEVNRGYAEEYIEPTLSSYDFYGTVFPGGSRIKNGKAFYSARKTIKAEEFFGKWDAPKRITFKCYDNDFNILYDETFDILRADLDDCYHDAQKEHKNVYIKIH